MFLNDDKYEDCTCPLSNLWRKDRGCLWGLHKVWRSVWFLKVCRAVYKSSTVVMRSSTPFCCSHCRLEIQGKEIENLSSSVSTLLHEIADLKTRLSSMTVPDPVTLQHVFEDKPPKWSVPSSCANRPDPNPRVTSETQFQPREEIQSHHPWLGGVYSDTAFSTGWGRKRLLLSG